jgi:hypothetical protein
MVRNIFTFFFFIALQFLQAARLHVVNFMSECFSLYSQLPFQGGFSTRNLNKQNAMVRTHLSQTVA